MKVPPLSGNSPELPTGSQPLLRQDEDLFRKTGAEPVANGEKGKLGEASRQFEGVLLRQFLSESLKPMLENGASGQVYGYYLNETISDSITKGGGLGLASVFQAQIAGQKGAK